MENDPRKVFPIEKYINRPIKDFEEGIHKINQNVVNLIRYSDPVSGTTANPSNLNDYENDVIAAINNKGFENKSILREKNFLLKDINKKFIISNQKFFTEELNEPIYDDEIIDINNFHYYKLIYIYI